MTGRRLARWSVLAAGVLLLSPAGLIGAGADWSEGRWSDAAHVEGHLGSGRWAVDGAGEAQVLRTSADLTVLADASLDLTLNESTADPTDPGPDTDSAATASGRSGSLETSLTADGATTRTAYGPKLTESLASTTTATVGVNLVGLVDLPALLAVSSDTSGGVVRASATCPAPGTAAATAPDLGSLQVSVLGTTVDAVAAGGPTGVTVDRDLGGLLRATVVLRLIPTATSTATSATAGLLAVLDVTVTSAGVTAARVHLDVDVVRAACQVTLP